MFGQSNEVGLLPIIANWRTIPESISSFLFPFNIKIIPNYSLIKTITGIVFLLGFIVVLFTNKTKQVKEKIFCLSWFIILLLPTMLFKHDMLCYLNHRFLLPLFGILLFILLFRFPKLSIGKIRSSWIFLIISIMLSSFTFLNTRSYSTPLVFYNTALSQNSDFAIGYYNRAIIFEKQGKYQEAIDDYSQAISTAPEYIDAWYNRGVLFGNMLLSDQAIADYNKVIELRPDFYKAYINRGVLYVNKGLYNNAIDDFSEAIEINPNFHVSYNNRGFAHTCRNEYILAIEDLTKAIELNSNYADAYNNRGIAYQRNGLYKEACEDFSLAVEFGSELAKENIEKYCK
jgi:tetratricopeptide (TPR) repeat protein